MTIKVEMLHHTPVDVIAQATAMPYNSTPSKGLVSRVWKSGHRAIARHGMAVFMVRNVSQSLLAQISRHPHINLMVMSSRYCDMSEREHVVPPAIMNNERLHNEYERDMGTVRGLYRKWVSAVGKEAAKMFIPKASTVDLVVSGNYQALFEFLQLRLCDRAEWEIRILANIMAVQIYRVIPEIFEDLGCRGVEYGFCPEHKTCGKYPSRKG